MKVTVGTAPDSWGVWVPSDPRQTPWERFLNEVYEAGYEWIELGPYGYLPTDAEILGRELKSRNLKLSGTFIMGHFEDKATMLRLEDDMNKVGELLAKFDAQYLVMLDDVYTDLFTGEPTHDPELNPQAWQLLIENVQKIAQQASERFGLKTVFHPHAQTHVEYEYQIERLLKQTDPKLVNLCLDLGHHAYCGGDPIAFMRKHHQRIPYLHLKSVDFEKRSRVAKENIPFAKAVEMDLFCEPALGAVDFPAFRDLLIELNFSGFGIVEQDMFPAPFDKPGPIAKRTRSYLKEIGIG